MTLGVQTQPPLLHKLVDRLPHTCPVAKVVIPEHDAILAHERPPAVQVLLHIIVCVSRVQVEKVYLASGRGYMSRK